MRSSIHHSFITDKPALDSKSSSVQNKQPLFPFQNNEAWENGALSRLTLLLCFVLGFQHRLCETSGGKGTP